ncbi:MAG: methyltransferase domain-containing protein [Terracidiphilus sp.]|jgi:SAM-dependent methyltransferase
MLHFAPENCLAKTIAKYVPDYKTADRVPGRGQMVLNIEKIDLPDNSVDAVIALHVLEHVDDRAALQEIRRVLVPGGMFITAVPIVEAWSTTYENPSVVSKRDRIKHYGADDHRRWYGRDFRDRLKEAGFTVEEFVGDGSDTVKYGLVRGDTIFICRAESTALRIMTRRHAKRHSYPGTTASRT